MKKIIIIQDAHIDVHIPKAYEVVKKFIKAEQPDEIILLGDFMDVSSLSAWDYDKKRLMEGRRFQKEVELANKELDFLQANSKKVTYLEGNHEDRIERYLDKNPEMEGMMELPVVLDLVKRDIKFIKYNTLYKVGHLYFTHGFYTNINYTKKTLDSYGCNIVVGHLHKPQTSFNTSKMTESRMCWGLGCLQGHEPDYLKGRPSNWNNGFAVAYVKDDGKFSMYPVNMSPTGSFIWNGKEYM
jgi:predicted phosphodiesterase